MILLLEDLQILEQVPLLQILMDKKKHQTKIGKNSSIGANTVFVAPINLGESVTTGAGSVITKDSKDNTLAISRTKQVNIENWKKRNPDLVN